MGVDDLRTLDGAVDALYASLCGPAGTRRDWDRFRALFAPHARLTQCRPADAAGRGPVEFADVEEYIAREGPGMDRDGFFERDIGRRVERYGRIASVFSTYETRRAPDLAPYTRGLNALQLYHDGERWWYVSILWDGETEGNPVPDRYRERPSG